MSEASFEKRIDQAASLISEENSDEAESLLAQVIAEISLLPQPLGPAAEQMSDAEEYLAEIALKGQDAAGAITHAQRAVLNSQRFRAKANFIAAEAFLDLGDTDLAKSKYELVADSSSHQSLVIQAKQRLARLVVSD